MQTIIEQGGTTRGLGNKKGLWKRIREKRVLFFLMLPGVLYLLLNNYLPMFGVLIAFKDINFTRGILKSEWIGFRNFKYLFNTQNALVITRNTLLYNFTFIVVNLVLAVTLAILLNEVRSTRLKRFYQNALLLPFFLSTVLVAYLVYSLLNPEYGFVNQSILAPLGLEPVFWYMETRYWPFILVAVNAWKSVGYSSVVYISAIIGIDTGLYEAATMDGARKMQLVRYITLPLLVPVVIIMTILAIGRIFYSDFGLFYQVPMNSGILLPVTNVIDTYVYRGMLQLGDIGMSSAAGVYQSFVGFVMVLLSNLAVRRLSPENALF